MLLCIESVTLDALDLLCRYDRLPLRNQIQSNRNWPCYQNSHAKLSRGGKEISVDDLMVYVNNLLDNGLFENKGDNDPEPFCMANESFDTERNGPENVDRLHKVSSMVHFT